MLVNTVISGRVFGLLLSVFVAGVATLVLYRQRRAPAAWPPAQPRALPTRTLTYALVAVLFGLAPYLALHG